MSLVKSTVLAAALALFGSGMTCIEAQADPVVPPPPAPKTTIDTDGLYHVGKDIVAGNYATVGPVADGTCSWRRADAAGTTIDNAISKKPQVITIASTDATFRTRGCQAWAPTDEAPPAPVSNLQAQIMISTLNGLSGAKGSANGAPAAPVPAAQAPAAPVLTAPTPTPAAPSG